MNMYERVNNLCKKFKLLCQKSNMPTLDYGFEMPKFLALFNNKLYCIYFVSNYIKSGDKYFFSEAYKKDYENLIRGLDDDSIKTVNKTLEIYKCYNKLVRKKRVNHIDVIKFCCLIRPSYKEKREIKKAFYSKVNKINENLYQYDKYYLRENHFETSVFYHKHFIDKLKTLDKIKNKNIIDVGGFIGDSAIVFSEYTDKKIYSFEALNDNFEKMKKNVNELNRVKNVVPVYNALGDKENEELNLSGCGSCVTVAKEEVHGTCGSVKSTTLDSFVSENNLDVGMIKVDIEGYEQKFLKGAINTIRTQKPALLISIYHSLDDYMHIKPMIESWNLGYKFRILIPKENRLFETLLIAEVSE